MRCRSVVGRRSLWEIPDPSSERMVDAGVGMRLPHPEDHESPQSTVQWTRCAACLDVIGVYEPLVHALGDLTWRTSRAAEPRVVAAEGELYHLDCYKRMGLKHPRH
jgi:hypothetical protein